MCFSRLALRLWQRFKSIQMTTPASSVHPPIPPASGAVTLDLGLLHNQAGSPRS